MAALKSAMSGDDREDIERKTTGAGAGLERAHAEDVRAVRGGRGRLGTGGAESGSAGQHAPKEDVLDAEFEEVKDSDRKKA